MGENPLCQCIVEGQDLVLWQLEHAPVIVVVPDADKLASDGVVLEDGEAAPLERSDQDIVVARAVRAEASLGEDLVCLWVDLSEDLCGKEAIDEERLSATGRRAVLGLCVAEEVEELEAGWVGKVGRVCMRAQRQVGVRRVAVREVRGEVPEAAVVRLADKGNPPHQRLGVFWRGWDARDEAEAELFLQRQREKERKRQGSSFSATVRPERQEESTLTILLSHRSRPRSLPWSSMTSAQVTLGGCWAIPLPQSRRPAFSMSVPGSPLPEVSESEGAYELE